MADYSLYDLISLAGYAESKGFGLELKTSCLAVSFRVRLGERVNSGTEPEPPRPLLTPSLTFAAPTRLESSKSSIPHERPRLSAWGSP
jgi:hypothetical protein